MATIAHVVGRTTPAQCLFEAAARNDCDAILQLGAAGVDPSAACAGETALHVACFCGHADAASALVSIGANPNSLQRSTGHSPLMIATLRQHRRCAVRLLRCRGIIPTNSLVAGGTALHVACETGCTALAGILLATKAFDVNGRDNTGLTPLCIAAKQAEGYELTKMLLMNGADPNITMRVLGVGYKRHSPLHAAVANYHENHVRLLLLCGACLTDRDSHGHTPIDIATLLGHRWAPLLELAARMKPLQIAVMFSAHALVHELHRAGLMSSDDLTYADRRTLFGLPGGCGRTIAVARLVLGGCTPTSYRAMHPRTRAAGFWWVLVCARIKQSWMDTTPTARGVVCTSPLPPELCKLVLLYL
jgi:ankyrin repeat protein